MSEPAAEEVPPHTNGVTEDADDDERGKMRPADIDADMKEMEKRKRVEMIMSSRMFREELERIIESQMKDGGGPAGLLQQIQDMVGGASRLHAGAMFKNTSCVVPINDIRGVESMGYAKGEKVLRCKLASVFRLMDLYGWTHGIHNNITARLSQEQEHFLVNPFGMMYHEITASSLVKVDMQGVVEQGTTNFGVDANKFQLHGAVHAARPDVKCIIHIHTPSVVAISSLKAGLLPLGREAAVLGEVTTHRFLGGVTEPEEKDKIARSLGPINKVLLLSNAGALCCGESIEEAFFNVYNTVLACETQVKLMPMGLDNLELLPDEARKAMYDAARKAPEGALPKNAVPLPPALEKKDKKWRIGGMEFEALMRMLDNAGFRTGYIYRTPLVKGEPPKPRNDVEVPPAVSSLGYLLEEEDMYNKGQWKKGAYSKNDRTRWLNSPNVYQKVEILETGTTDPKKITKWVADGSPTHTSTPVRIDVAMQFVPKNTNPKEFKKLQQQGSESDVNNGRKLILSCTYLYIMHDPLQDASISMTGDQVIQIGAASKGIIQRGFQHNATVYKTPYAKNPFDCMSDQELEDYKKVVTRKQKGDYYDEDASESEALSSSAALPPSGVKSPPSETEDDSRTEPRVLRIETKTAPVPSQAEVVLSDVEEIDAILNQVEHDLPEQHVQRSPSRFPPVEDFDSWPEPIKIICRLLTLEWPKFVVRIPKKRPSPIVEVDEETLSPRENSKKEIEELEVYDDDLLSRATDVIHALSEREVRGGVCDESAEKIPPGALGSVAKIPENVPQPDKRKSLNHCKPHIGPEELKAIEGSLEAPQEASLEAPPDASLEALSGSDPVKTEAFISADSSDTSRSSTCTDHDTSDQTDFQNDSSDSSSNGRVPPRPKSSVYHEEIDCRKAVFSKVIDELVIKFESIHRIKSESMDVTIVNQHEALIELDAESPEILEDREATGFSSSDAGSPENSNNMAESCRTDEVISHSPCRSHYHTGEEFEGGTESEWTLSGGDLAVLASNPIESDTSGSDLSEDDGKGFLKSCQDRSIPFRVVDLKKLLDSNPPKLILTPGEEISGEEISDRASNFAGIYRIEMTNGGRCFDTADKIEEISIDCSLDGTRIADLENVGEVALAADASYDYDVKASFPRESLSPKISDQPTDEKPFLSSENCPSVGKVEAGILSNASVDCSVNDSSTCPNGFSEDQPTFFEHSSHVTLKEELLDFETSAISEAENENVDTAEATDVSIPKSESSDNFDYFPGDDAANVTFLRDSELSDSENDGNSTKGTNDEESAERIGFFVEGGISVDEIGVAFEGHSTSPGQQSGVSSMKSEAGHSVSPDPSDAEELSDNGDLSYDYQFSCGSWDESLMALTGFPSVEAMIDRGESLMRHGGNANAFGLPEECQNRASTPSPAMSTVDPLDILEKQIDELEQKIVGNSQPIAKDQPPIVESLTNSTRALSNAVANYDSIVAVFDRINELGTYLDPIYEDSVAGTVVKAKLVLESETEIRSMLDNLNKLRAAEECLSSDPYKEIPALTDRLRQLSEQIVRCTEDFESSEQSTRKLSEDFYAAMMTFDRAIQLITSALAEIEVSTMPKKEDIDVEL
ncbi:unnamed protein product, partial [Nesidiocoris tenuis]